MLSHALESACVFGHDATRGQDVTINKTVSTRTNRKLYTHTHQREAQAPSRMALTLASITRLYQSAFTVMPSTTGFSSMPASLCEAASRSDGGKSKP